MRIVAYLIFRVDESNFVVLILPNCDLKPPAILRPRPPMSHTWHLSDHRFDPLGPTHHNLTCGATGTMLAQASPTPSPAYKHTPDSPSTSPQPTPSAYTPPATQDLEMRTFRVRGPFGLQVTLATTVPGTLSITFPDRAQSEPPVAAHSMSRAASKPIQRSYSDLSFTIPMDVPSTSSPPSPSQLQSIPIPPRPASLAPTEIIPEDPTQAECVAAAQRQGIKVRDFAYEPVPGGKPILEHFDPYKALGEHDYRLAQHPRVLPIQGKTLRRLLDVGWVTLDEGRRRWHQMDWDALALHDSRPAYPWKPLGHPVPTPAERRVISKAQERFWSTLDRMRREEEERIALEEHAERVREALVLAEAMRQGAPRECDERDDDLEMDEPRGVRASGSKRSLESDGDGEGGSHDPAGVLTPAKRRRLSGPGTSMPMPTQQYPAPLDSYDPELYPLAAGIIQSQGKAREVVTPPRADTPPLDEGVTGRGGRGHGRTLSRTQSFTQL